MPLLNFRPKNELMLGLLDAETHQRLFLRSNMNRLRQ